MGFSAIVLGGCGRMGSRSVQLLLADEECVQVGVAGARADWLAARLPTGETYLAPERMSAGTGVGGAIAAGLVPGGHLKARGGGFAPESAFAPSSYFAAMQRVGLHIEKLT